MQGEENMKKCFVLLVASFVLGFALSAFAINPLMISKGQVVSVPATWLDITSTGQISSSRLVIRNIDPFNNPIVVYGILFVDTLGHITKNLLDGRDCAGNPTGGATSVNLGSFQSTSFVTSETTVCVSRFPQSDVGRPSWLVYWDSVKGNKIVAPSIGATIDILTPTFIYGHEGTPFYIIDSSNSVSGTVVSDHQ